MSSQGYRFRGDGRAAFAGWGAMPRQPGYRFRPLTEQERLRMGSGAGWRPYAPEQTGVRPYAVDSPPSDEAYGFWPDGWLRRYQDGRP